ncbi:hypothetical protein BT63DRAFT_426507 [Microthyrium microscopicum]|uniref:Uncharacterized protein n=1 Tax=Microthyrium microscopicum TaxID=703497 RepID=A0A6A6U6S8_9PEZI|nr:hypothetical protein BT63DRAFT_426507 [Microthyrium microscopicum]
MPGYIHEYINGRLLVFQLRSNMRAALTKTKDTVHDWADQAHRARYVSREPDEETWQDGQVLWDRDEEGWQEGYVIWDKDENVIWDVDGEQLSSGKLTWDVSKETFIYRFLSA